MADRIKLRRGSKSKLDLNAYELGYVTDSNEERLYFNNGRMVPIPNDKDITDMKAEITENKNSSTQNKKDVSLLKESLSIIKTDINNIVASKANQSDLENANSNIVKNANDIKTQKARIDTLSKLGEGSTTGDAELIDARVDILGNTHANLGESIRSQVNFLNNNINNILTISDFESGSIYFQKEDGKLTGCKKTDSKRARTKEFIKLSKGDKIRISSDIYRFAVVTFTSKGNIFLTELKYWFDKNIEFTINEDYYVKIIVGKKDESEITNSDISDINNNIINIIKTKIYNIDTELTKKNSFYDNHKDIECGSVDLNYMSLWEHGTFDNSGSNNTWHIEEDDSRRIRTNSFIPKSLSEIKALDGYEFAIGCLNDKAQPKGVIEDDLFLDTNELKVYYNPTNKSFTNTAFFMNYLNVEELLSEVGEYNNFRLVVRKKDNSKFTVNDYNNIQMIYNSSIPVIKKQVNNIISTSSIIYVAASNSFECDKNKSDFVCDGVNDVDIINRAFEFIRRNKLSGKIIFFNGTYYINKVEDLGELGQYVFPIKEPHCQRGIEIEGLTPPIRKANSNPIDLANSAIFKLSNNIYDSIGDKGLTIFGALPNPSDGHIMYPNLVMNIKNIGIVIPNNKKKIIGIDGFYCSDMKVSDVIMCAQAGDYSTGYSVDKVAIEDCIGIRGLQGYNFGAGYRIDNCFMYFMGIGYSLGGEHLIGCNLGAYGCLYSYGWGLYENDRESIHPNTLLNCCGEQCVNDMIFGHSKKHQVINIIDYNMEVMTGAHGWPMNPSKELYPGEYRGQVTYTPCNDYYANDANLPFWADGSGETFRTLNLVSKQIGTTSERPLKPNLYQKYWDRTLNKEIIYIDGVWKDSNGNNV